MSETTWVAVLATACFAAPASAEEISVDRRTSDYRQIRYEKMAGGEHGKTDHSVSGHSQPTTGRTQASGVGVINSVNADERTINITHEPIPELGWPIMTMDLAVTKDVDLSKMEVGDNVDFKVKLGRDKQYRINDIKAAE